MHAALNHLSENIRHLLRIQFEQVGLYEQVNEWIHEASGILDFFPTQDSLEKCLSLLKSSNLVRERSPRREFGDYQTPRELTDKICVHLSNEGVTPKMLVEPTFGKGNFVLSALQYFPSLEYVYGVEIYEPYIWYAKFAVLEWMLNHPSSRKITIELLHQDVFDVDFTSIASRSDEETLLLGNPPWITNSELGQLGSTNLPQKENFKQHQGLDARTGKSNFDLSEYIVLMLLDAFSEKSIHLAMLLKNSVIRNLVRDLPGYAYNLANLVALHIDSKSYFNASVDASLFTCHSSTQAAPHQCRSGDFENSSTEESYFGWVGKQFVSDTTHYVECARYDGISPLIWRQGVKHDCAKVMELTRDESIWENGFGEKVEIEENLLFGLAKSSDLREVIARKPRKEVIVTQRKPGEETLAKLARFPKLLNYLEQHLPYFEQRKSSIYRNQPPFAIFGVGDYSFKPFKVAMVAPQLIVVCEVGSGKNGQT